MQIYEHLSDLPPLSCCLTIGFFDGMHLGHQAVLKRLLEAAKEENVQPALLSFRNHPRSVLKPDSHLDFITPLTQRLELIEKAGVQTLFLLPFTLEFSRQSPEEFLKALTDALELKRLILGHDALLGHQRQGNRLIVENFGKKHGFGVEYLLPATLEGAPVSSSRVRAAIHDGDFSLAARLLGRPYTLILPIQKGQGIGKKMGFPTANLPVDRLALPPRGVYSVRVNKSLPAIANLGVAPTVRSDPAPQLEVHILDGNPDFSDQTLEVEFVRFIRPEEKFDTLQELKAQIKRDIETARNQLF